MEETAFFIMIPAYNCKNTIKRAVQSVTSQGYESFRLVIVDDGSSDGTEELCDQLAKTDERLYVVHQPNKGQLAARLSGIAYASDTFDASGAYYLFLDADDALKDGALRRIADMIGECRYDMIIYDIERVDEASAKTLDYMRGTKHGVVTDKAELYRTVFFDYQYNSLCRKAIRAELVSPDDAAVCREFSGIRHGEDLLQSAVYYRKASSVFFTDDVLYTYYQLNSSVSHQSVQLHSDVRSYIWRMVEEEKVWDEETFRLFSAYNCRLLRNKVIRVCLSNAPVNKRAEDLDALYHDAFYSRILRENESRDRITALFAQRRYPALIRYVRARQLLVRMAARFRRS